MASRVEARTQLMEYSQLFMAAFTIVLCTVWVAAAMPRMMDELGFEASGVPGVAYTLRWGALLLLPVYIATIWQLKRKQASRATVIVAAYLFAVASLIWVAIAFLPLTMIGNLD